MVWPLFATTPERADTTEAVRPNLGAPPLYSEARNGVATAIAARCDSYFMTVAKILPRSFYARDTVTVARDLLGKMLVHGRVAGRIVEVEAYLGIGDRAAHSARGVTPRTRVIFGPPGHAYVYFIYGMYECLNIVAEPDGVAGCVLIRALEPVGGVSRMREWRPGVQRVEDLANGPGKLTLAMGIGRSHYGADLTRGSLTVRDGPAGFEIVTTTRIGIRQSAELPLRFYVAGNACVSGSGLAADGQNEVMRVRGARVLPAMEVIRRDTDD